jgi:hypothetical protein
MAEYEIWQCGCGGTNDTEGRPYPAHFHGKAEGKDFEEACRKFFADDVNPYFGGSDFNPERMTYWGCPLVDNEAEARAKYG